MALDKQPATENIFKDLPELPDKQEDIFDFAEELANLIYENPNAREKYLNGDLLGLLIQHYRLDTNPNTEVLQGLSELSKQLERLESGDVTVDEAAASVGDQLRLLSYPISAV